MRRARQRVPPVMLKVTCFHMPVARPPARDALCSVANPFSAIVARNRLLTSPCR